MSLRRRIAGLTADEQGCLFRARCPHAFERCLDEPDLLDVDPAHRARCWLVVESRTPAGERRLLGRT
jgi:ABC-type dipeptide/oligopeptide/nickel transport system ATPase component